MENLSSSPFKRLHPDLLADIMARLDGSTLAAAACTNTDFRDLARDQRLWRQLCHSTWPSTTMEEARDFISSSAMGGFRRFYADSYPLTSYIKGNQNSTTTQPRSCSKLKTHVSPSDFASLVDVYYKGKCILSRVLDGIPEAVDIDVENATDTCNGDVLANDRRRWFSDCPFKLDLLSYDYDEYNNRHEDHEANNINGRRGLPITTHEEDGTWKDHCDELGNDLRLSWVLLDKKKGKAVNLSSWKPLSVQRSWPSEGDYIMNFGCIVPVESVLPQKLAKCTIMARCTLGETEGGMRWREISMIIEDMKGAHLSGRNSWLVLNQALYCPRTTNLLEIERGFIQYEKQKQETKKKREFMERMVDSLYLSLEVTAFVSFCYIFNLL